MLLDAIRQNPITSIVSVLVAGLAAYGAFTAFVGNSTEQPETDATVTDIPASDTRQATLNVQSAPVNAIVPDISDAAAKPSVDMVADAPPTLQEQIRNIRQKPVVDPFAESVAPRKDASGALVLLPNHAHTLRSYQIQQTRLVLALEFAGIAAGDPAPRVRVAGMTLNTELNPIVESDRLSVTVEGVRPGEAYLVDVEDYPEKSLPGARYLIRIE